MLKAKVPKISDGVETGPVEEAPTVNNGRDEPGEMTETIRIALTTGQTST